MTDAQRQAAATAFWADDESLAEQTEVMLLLSRKLNFRYRSVETLAPSARRRTCSSWRNCPRASRRACSSPITCRRSGR